MFAHKIYISNYHLVTLLIEKSIHGSTITVKLYVWYCVCPSHTTKTAVTRWCMDSKRPLELSCVIWHQHVSHRSFTSWKLQGCIFMQRTSHGYSIWLRSGEFVGRGNTLNSVLQIIPDQFWQRGGWCALSSCENVLGLQQSLCKWYVPK